MKNLKRNICTIIVLMIVLLTMCLPSYASTIEVNRDSLKTAFETLFNEAVDENGQITGGAKVKRISDTEIELQSGEDTIKFNYEVKGDKVLFKKKATITQGMSYESYEKEIENLSMPLMGYIAVNRMAEVKIEKSVTYFVFSMLQNAISSSLNMDTDAVRYLVVEDDATTEVTGNTKVIKKSDFGIYAVEYAEYTYGQGETYSDEKTLNTYSMEYKTNKNDKKYEIECIFTVNLNGDFAKINEMNLGEEDVTEKHEYVEKVIIEPTCTSEGLKVFMCKTCDDAYTEKISKTKHNYEERMRVDATCTKNGTIGYMCTNCGELYTKVTSKAKGHNYDVSTIDATCTTQGRRTYTCSRCNDSYTEIISDAIGHNYNETVNGNTKVYTCENCSHSYTEQISNVGSDINDSQMSGSSIDYNKILIIAGGVVLGLIVITVIAIVIIKSRE